MDKIYDAYRIDRRPAPSAPYHPYARKEDASSCMCGECAELLKELRAIDFTIYDLTLYLDVYPECAQAEEKLCALRAERGRLAAEFEKACGMLTMYGVCGSSAPWGKTLDMPAPWEYAAN